MYDACYWYEKAVEVQARWDGAIAAVQAGTRPTFTREDEKMVFTPPRNRRGRPTSYKSLPDKSIDFDGDQKGVTIYAKEPGNFEYMELLDKCMEENDGRGADLDYGYKTMFMRFMYVCANEGHPT